MELLTVDETARILRVNPITVRRYISSGRLGAVRVGRRVRVPRDSLEKFARPVKPTAAHRYRVHAAGKPFTLEDPLWNIVGNFDSGASDVSQSKYKYLAEAYATKSE